MSERPNVPNQPVKKPVAAGALPAKPAAARDGQPKQRCNTPQQELEVLIRARYPIIYLVSWEEERVEQYLAKIAQKRNKKVYVWSLWDPLESTCRHASLSIL